MRRTEQVQGLRLMKFEEVYGRTHRARRRRRRFVLGAHRGAGATATRRREPTVRPPPGPPLGAARAGGRGGAGAGVVRHPLLGLHFHELVADHGFKRSYNWLRLSLQAHGRRRAAPRRGAHRRNLPGMMLHQDGSSHEWVPGRWWDLIVTMDEPAISTRPSSSPKRAPCRASRGCPGDLGQGPVLLALRRPRQPLLEHARGRRQGGQGHPDPGRPRPGAAIELTGLLNRAQPACPRKARR